MSVSLKPEITEYLIELTRGLYQGHTLKLEDVCKKLGLKVMLADFDDERLSGAIIKDDNTDTYTIYVNKNHHPNRRRFTIAHEIGHYISFKLGSYSKDELIANEGFEDYAMSFRQDGVSSAAETEANQIAAEILMPELKVRTLVEQGHTIEDMADLFFVSASAMTIRVQNIFGTVFCI